MLIVLLKVGFLIAPGNDLEIRIRTLNLQPHSAPSSVKRYRVGNSPPGKMYFTTLAAKNSMVGVWGERVVDGGGKHARGTTVVLAVKSCPTLPIPFKHVQTTYLSEEYHVLRLVYCKQHMKTTCTRHQLDSPDILLAGSIPCLSHVCALLWNIRHPEGAAAGWRAGSQNRSHCR